MPISFVGFRDGHFSDFATCLIDYGKLSPCRWVRLDFDPLGDVVCFRERVVVIPAVEARRVRQPVTVFDFEKVPRHQLKNSTKENSLRHATEAS